MHVSKALVVDDEAHITHVVALKLRNAGFEVFTASDGEEAYEIACAELPDIVITDLQMPYMTGLELCEQLKRNTATEKIPAILLTARGHALSSDDLSKTNIREVLGKPFSPREVLSKAAAMLGVNLDESTGGIAA
ncbi:MAG: response regulator [Phycisphaerales bacterium]|nr:MAG: response regulator [Phycisphaerales bacterium]